MIDDDPTQQEFKFKKWIFNIYIVFSESWISCSIIVLLNPIEQNLTQEVT